MKYLRIIKGCVSELVNGDRHTQYSEHMDVDHKFSFKAFIFSQQSNNISMTCNVQICLPGEESKFFTKITRKVQL